jgi:hypothetical protein
MASEDKIFKAYRKKCFDIPLKEFGFVKYRTNCLARITGGNVLQLFNFQKDAYGRNQFCINVIFRPLFWHNDSFPMNPSFRLTSDREKQDQWYSYAEEYVAEVNFTMAHELIMTRAMPLFEKTKDAEDIVSVYEAKLYPEMDWGYSPWLEFYLGVLYLKVNAFDKAFEYLEKASDGFSRSRNSDLHPYAKLCDEILHSMDNKDKINDLLESNRHNSIALLKLEKLIGTQMRNDNLSL